MKLRTIILIGAGGHCKACIDLVLSTGLYKIAGLVDLKQNVGKLVLGYPIIATDDDLDSLKKKCDVFGISIGQIASPLARIRIYNNLKQIDAEMPGIFSPTSYVSSFAKVGDGTMIFHHSIINANAAIGNNCIINNHALVEHDSIVEDHCHIATSAVLNGNVVVKEGSFIGSNATVLQGITVGAYSIAAGGSVIIKNIGDREIIAGVPGRLIRRNA